MAYTQASSRLKPVPLNVRHCTVGAGLLAKALCQALQQRKSNRVRQQAGSLYLDFVFSEGKVLD